MPGLPRDLELICLKCLEKDPRRALPDGPGAGRRPATVRRWRAGRASGPAGVVERAAMWARRKPALAAAYALDCWRCCSGGLRGRWPSWQLAGAAERAGQAAERARDGEAARDAPRRLATAEAAARPRPNGSGRSSSGSSTGGRSQVAHQEWRENNVAATLALLDSTRPDLRGWEWRYVHRLCHSDLLTLKGHTGPVIRRRSARTGRGSSPRVRTRRRRSGTPTGAEVLTLKGHTGCVTSASFSPDGSRVVTASDDKTAKVWDARTGAEVLTLKGHTGGVHVGVVQPGRVAGRHRESGRDGEGLGRDDRRRDPHPQGAHRSRSSRRRSARTARGSSPRVGTRRRRSGTPRPVPSSSRSRGTPVASVRRRSARTGRGSSPRVRTRRRRSGTRGPAPRSSPSRGTPMPSLRRRSAPTARGSSPRVGTRRRGSGTPRRVPRSSPSRGTPVASTSASFSPDGSRDRHRE